MSEHDITDKIENQQDHCITESEGFLEDVDSRFRWRSISVEGWICLPIFWILAAVVFWQFFTRYFLNDSAVWTEELARQLLILLTFFGSAYAITTRAHISINYFISLVTGRPRQWADHLALLIQLSFYSYGAMLSLDIAEATKYQRLMSFDVSKSVIYQTVAVSFGLMALRSAMNTFRVIRDNVGTAKHQTSTLKPKNNKVNKT